VGRSKVLGFGRENDTVALVGKGVTLTKNLPEKIGGRHLVNVERGDYQNKNFEL
jgi:hypothetical protein